MAASSGLILMSEDGAVEIVPGVYKLGAQGNALAIETGLGIILMDTGPGGEKTKTMISSLRAVSDLPVHSIVYSHGHVGYNFGCEQWINHSIERGDPAPRVLAHARLPARYRRYRETAGLQSWLNTRQFRTNVPAEVPDHWYRMPDETYEKRLVIHGGIRDVELIYAPSETDDVTALWLPKERLLYGSASCIHSVANIGTPLRTLRDPIRWAETMEMMNALSPAILMPEFGDPIHGEKEVSAFLLLVAQVLRWMRKEVVDRMNKGMSLNQILHDMVYPQEWLDHPRLQQRYGAFDYIVQDIWRAENGWWDRNPTTLHSATEAEAGEAMFSAIADPARAISRARELDAEGKMQLALNVLDMLVNGPADNVHVQEARALKAECCCKLAETVAPFVSRQLYLSAADDLMGRPVAPEGVSLW